MLCLREYEYYAFTLRGYQAARNEMKSEHREDVKKVVELMSSGSGRRH